MTMMESWYVVIPTNLERPDLPFQRRDEATTGGSLRLSMGFTLMKNSTLLPSDMITYCVKDLRGSFLSA